MCMWIFCQMSVKRMNKTRSFVVYCMFTDVEENVLLMLLMEFDVIKWLFPRYSKTFILDVSLYTPSQSPWVTSFLGRSHLLSDAVTSAGSLPFWSLSWGPGSVWHSQPKCRAPPAWNESCTSALGHSGHGIQPPEWVLRDWMVDSERPWSGSIEDSSKLGE